MSDPELIVDFYGVYLLYNVNPKNKGKTYIGYTRNPKRRLAQHNRGTWAGGASRTTNKGPWKMVMIIHGFPSNISALRFEWAWQNPNKTLRLQHLNLKIQQKEPEFQFKLRVLSEMLSSGPWNCLPLTIRWLENEFFVEFQPEKKPPDHMRICHGPIRTRNLKAAKNSGGTSPKQAKCDLCSKYLNIKEHLTCLNPNCDLVAHITCLADKFLAPGEYVPIDGVCPKCQLKLNWGDLIRKMKGCMDITLEGLEDAEESNSDDDSVSSQDCQFVDSNSWFLHCDEDV